MYFEQWREKDRERRSFFPVCSVRVAEAKQTSRTGEYISGENEGELLLEITLECTNANHWYI